ncbi:MAG: hypothetical protein ACYCZB_09930 [Acidiphilium sp.]
MVGRLDGFLALLAGRAAPGLQALTDRLVVALDEHRRHGQPPATTARTSMIHSQTDS